MVQYTDDAAFIRAELEKRFEEMLDWLYPGHEVYRGKAYLSPKIKSGKKSRGSFTANLTGGHRGQWYRFSQSIGGGAVELISYHFTNRTDSYRIAFEKAREFLGIERKRPETAQEKAEIERQMSEAKAQAEVRRAETERLDRAKKQERQQTASEVWQCIVRLAGTHGEKYLVDGRGLPIPPGGWPDCLGFIPNLEYELDRRFSFPAVIARVDDVVGDLTGIWRIYLDPRKVAKADVEYAKVGLGVTAGGAVRLGGVAPHIGMGEGLESSIGAWALIRFRRPVWSALSTSGMAGFEPPLGVQRIDPFPDGDARARRKDGVFVPEDQPPGMRAARTLSERMKSLNIGGVIQPEPPQGQDYNDIYRAARAVEEQL